MEVDSYGDFVVVIHIKEQDVIVINEELDPMTYAFVAGFLIEIVNIS